MTTLSQEDRDDNRRLVTALLFNPLFWMAASSTFVLVFIVVIAINTMI